MTGREQRQGADEPRQHNPQQQDGGAAAPESDAMSSADAGLPAWEKRVEEAQAEAGRYKDQLLRKAAEFENYKRRTEVDWQNFQRAANERLLLSFLPIVDDLERSLKSGAERKNAEAFYQGVELIYTKFLQTLKAVGVEPLEAVGRPFSVDEHDALLQVPSADAAPGTVVQEVEKGYRLQDRVLRHAKVIVAADRAAQEGASQGGSDDKA